MKRGCRYDPKMTSEARKDISNGIWLCRNHTDEIDRFPEKYPAGRLKKIKKLAEQQAEKELNHGQSIAKINIQIKPINLQGENISHVTQKGKDPNDLDRFFVKIHFQLWAEDDLQVINIDLQYDIERAMPNEQKIIIDCSQEKSHHEIEKLNNLYRMIDTRLYQLEIQLTFL
jgi:hypothetical protein